MKLKKATNRVAYAKIGLYGESASGKSYTAMKFAIGLYEHAQCKKPVAMFDTEPAASFLIPHFEKAGVDFVLFDESRALADLMGFIDEAEKSCCIAIVDSITHVWREAQSAYLKAINTTRSKQRRPQIRSLEFHHWGPIKAEWAKFTDRYLSSKLHMIVCGRAGTIYSYQKNEDTGKMELISTGTKMATEKELAYEPSLLIEMVKERRDGRIINRALIEKDRADVINGKEFDFPTFENILPHIERLNLGGKHFDSLDSKTSEDLFEGADDAGNWDREKQQREIESEELKGVFVEFGLDGTSKDAQKRRLQLMEEVFATRSWTAICDKPSKKIKEGRLVIKDLLSREAAEAVS